ncbi:MAG: ATP-dependent DNA helicase PcrA, partial [Actinomycetes bacterium]
MLFDPYSDGPFKAAPAAAARTKSPSEGAAAASATGGSVRLDRAPEGKDQGSRTPGAAQLLEGLNPQQEEAVKHAGPALLIVAGAGSG